MPVRRSIFLTLSLAALLAVAGVSAWAVWKNAKNAQSSIALLHEREVRTQAALGEIRAGVYLIAILTRDALLDEGTTPQPDYLTQFDSIKANAGVSMRMLRDLAPTGTETATQHQLQLELEGYWASTQDLLTASQPKDERTNLLRSRVARRREILRLTERIADLTVESTARERARISEADQYFRSSLAWISGIALLLGLGISGFTLARMRTLEHQSEAAESALRSLSGQLRTAQEQERKSLSRELHDQVGQMLTGLRMELAALAQPSSRSPEEQHLGFDRAKATVEQTLGIVRNIAMLLRPSMLDDLGLTPALIWLSKEVSRTSGVEIRRTIDSRVDKLPDAHRTCLFRVVQEALTNMARHSGARTVDLEVAVTGGFVRARVADDGKGFDTTLDKEKGLGLLGMQERVRELGGDFHVTSVPGRGTSVEIRLPQPATMEGANDQSADRGRSRNRPDRVKTTV